jgi:hypothetical protein
MEIKGLSYKEFAMIREAILEKREKIWKERVEEPFKERLKQMSFEEVKDCKKHFDENLNDCLEQGICNKILQKIEMVETNAQEELDYPFTNGGVKKDERT